MKFLLIFFSCILSTHASVDGFITKPPGEKLPKERFHALIKLMQKEFGYLAEKDGRKLQFFYDYKEDWAQAFARRWETDQVIVYGGASGLRGGTEDSFIMILCHELGHLYGGKPFSDEYNRLSVEGQADYWSTSYCWQKIMPKLVERTPSELSLRECNYDEACARGVDAGLVVTAFYADNRNIPHPGIDTPDPSVVQETLRVHPEPQCRLDTLLAGLIKELRPSCWFASE
ncbi:MAG: hypothetical protein ACLGHN_02630 [Bacteriovoracia bacterium]